MGITYHLRYMEKAEDITGGCSAYTAGAVGSTLRGISTGDILSLLLMDAICGSVPGTRFMSNSMFQYGHWG